MILDRTIRALAVVAVLVLVSCTSGAPDRDISRVRTALAEGRQADIDAFTASFLSKPAPIPAAAVRDQRPVASHLIVRIGREGGPIQQLGVAVVADFFLCLLEASHGVDSEDAVPRIHTDPRCPRDGDCEPCNSLTYPVPDDLRREMVSYWARRGYVRE